MGHGLRTPPTTLLRACAALLLLLCATARPAAAQGTVQLRFDPPTLQLNAGDRARVALIAANVPAPGLAGFQATFQFDAAPIDLGNPNEVFRSAGVPPFAPLGGNPFCAVVRNTPTCPDPAWFLISTGRTPRPVIDTLDNDGGLLTVAYGSSTTSGQLPAIGTGVIAYFDVVAVANGSSVLRLVNTTLVNDQEPPDNTLPFESTTLTIRVGAVANQPPALDPIGPQSVNEGATLTIPVRASDPEGSALVLTATGLPAFAALVDNGDGTGTITASPGAADAGTYPITVTASETGSSPLSDTETFTLTVGDVNRAPVLDPIGAQNVDEGGTLTVTIRASDPDGGTLRFVASGVPAFATFVDNGNGTATFSAAPGFAAAGAYPIAVVVSDAATPSLSDSETFTLTVRDVNRPPVLDPIGAQSVDQEATLTLTLRAADPDGGALRFTSGALPPFTSLTDNGNGTATFSATPGFTAAGAYPIAITVSDAATPALTDSETFTLTVTDVNRPPVLDPIGAQSVNQGATLTLTFRAADPDGGALRFTTGALPAFASLTDNGNGTATFKATPPTGSAGEYPIAVTVTDSGTPPLSDSETFSLRVVATNTAPVLDPIGPQSVAEGATLTLTFRAQDAEPGTLRFTTGTLPAFATLTDNGNGTATFKATPPTGSAGEYPIAVTVTDAGTPPLSDSETFSLRVVAVNRPPVLDPIGPKSVAEGATLTLTLRATDPDGGALRFGATGLPTFATFTDGGNGTATFVATPTFTDAGAYPIAITVNDSATPALTDSETFTLTVTDVARVPVANAGPDQVVSEGARARLDGTGSKTSEGGSLRFRWTQVAGPNVTLDDAASATPSFSAPFLEMNQTLTFELVVSEGTATSAPDSVDVTVKQSNSAPVADAGDDFSARAGAQAELDGSQSFDPDGDDIASYRWLQVAGPPVVLTPSNTAVKPRFEVPATGSQLVFKLIVSDGLESSVPSTGTDPAPADTVALRIVANSRPVARAGDDQNVGSAARVTLDGSGSSDPDAGDSLSFRWTQVSGPAVTLEAPTTAKPSFTAPRVASGRQVLAFELVVTDSDPRNPLASTPDRVSITVQGETAGLDCSKVRLSPATLFPPNHKLIPVKIDGIAGAGIEITGVTQDEPVDGLGIGDSAPDAVIQAGGKLLLRAERAALRNGRVYEISFVASDGPNTCTGTVRASVPILRKGSAVDDGQNFESTADPDAGSCTQDENYWETHNRFEHGSRRIPWPIDEGTRLCGRSFLQTLRTPAFGNPLSELAHQWIAASINRASGATLPAEVQNALDAAGELLALCKARPSAREREKAAVLAKLLHLYNEGVIGPGSCRRR